MRKTLIQKIINGTKIASTITLIPIIIGCTTLPKEQIQEESQTKEFVTWLMQQEIRTFPEGHIHGVEYSTIDQSKVPYNLEEQILYGTRYYLQETEKTSETLPFVFLPFDKVIREIDLNSNKITLDSEEKYIPKLVEVEKYTKDQWADEIALRATGLYGIKADMISLDELREIEGVSKNDSGFSAITTEDGASYIIKTKTILGNEYFLPYVADKKTSEKGKLPFYLIPVKGAKIKIENACGNISIRNENKIYRPELVKDTEKEISLQPGIEQRITGN